MRKEVRKERNWRQKKKWIIRVIVIIVVLLILFIFCYFMLNKTGEFSFGFAGFDFSSSARIIDNIGDAANTNTFESIKLNPFVNKTG